MATLDRARLDAVCLQFGRVNTPAELIVCDPTVPVLLLVWPTTDDRPIELAAALDQLAWELVEGDIVFRGTEHGRLGESLQQGLDCNPLWAADDPMKALEYGGWPKALLLLRASSFERSFVEVSADSTAEELKRLRRRYRSEIPAVDGKTLWFTQFERNDRRAASPYESSYGYWWDPASGNSPMVGLLLVARSRDEANVLARNAGKSAS